MPPLKYPAYIPASKKDMSPEIKQTINALGFAQKPHLPGVQPRNQKSLAPIISNKMPEREMASRILGCKILLQLIFPYNKKTKIQFKKYQFKQMSKENSQTK